MLKYKGFVKQKFDWTIMAGGMIVPHILNTEGNKQNFQARQNPIV